MRLGQVYTILDRCGGWLLPPRCVLCDGRGQPPLLDLCATCEKSLPPADPLVQPGPAPLHSSCAPFEYGHPLDHLVHALKYRGQLAVGRVLGSLLGRRMAAVGLGRAADVLVPVPLHRSRHLARGFNQSVEIARWVSRQTGSPVDATLAERRRCTLPQVGLHERDRATNVRNAFVAAAGVRGRRVVVIDDVITTGSTLQALATALLAAGAVEVDAWCVARAGGRSIRQRSSGEPSPWAGRMS
jgi:ComF family protein